MEWLFFLCKLSAVSFFLYMPYALFLKRLTFFGLNRWYLVGIFPLALLLVAFPLPSLSNSWIPPVTSLSEALPSSNVPLEAPTATASETSTNWQFWLTAVYLLGLLISLVLSLKGFLQLYQLSKQCEESHEATHNGFRVFRSSLLQQPFSFLKWVFLPKHLQGKELDVVMAHERFHSRYMHSIDSLIHELWKAVLWFNPVVYFVHASIRTNHEFQVDSKIIQEQFSITEYLQSIASFTYQQPGSMAVNTFKSKNIKKRILMMNHPKNTSRSLWAYFILVPLALVISLAFVMKGEDHTPSISPIKGAEISSGFGMRKSPITKDMKLHGGVDFRAQKHTPIVATANGTVTLAKEEGKWGNLIIISHGSTYTTKYAHLESIQVEEGASVTIGQTIGTVGSTGLSTGPHLHYEILKDGERVDPATFLK